MGYPVFYSDLEAKKNMLHNLDLISQITKSFGKESYVEGKINTTYLSSLIFSDPNAKEQLNKLVHPSVYQSFDLWKEKQHSAFVFNESALLIETGSFHRFDKIVLVSAPTNLKIRRIMKRDTCSKEEAIKKMKAQWSDEQNRKHCFFEIINDEKSALLPQIWKLITSL